MDYIFAAIDGWLIISSLRSIIVGREIVIKGKIFGKVLVSIVLFGAIAFGLWYNRDYFQYLSLLTIATAIAFLLYTRSSAGLNDEGLIYNGKLIPYERMEFFTYEFEDSDPFCIRFNNGVKDYSVYFKKNQEEQVKAYLANSGVRFQESE